MSAAPSLAASPSQQGSPRGQLPPVFWTPDQLADVVSVPYLLIGVYFVSCAFAIGNYVGYFRYNYNEMYGSGVSRAYVAFVVIGTTTFVLFSSVVWLWAAKYSASRSLKAQRLQWGVWAIFILKDFPLFVIELHAMMCCGWNSDYQGFVFIVQSILATFSFTFTWLSFIWRAANVFQKYFGSFHEVTLKTGAEQVLIFTPPEPINPEMHSYVGSPQSQQRGGSNGGVVGITWSGGRHSPRNGPAPRYSPPTSPLGRYTNGGAHGDDGDGNDMMMSYKVAPSPADQLPVRRQPMPSPWDRRPAPPSPQRHAMMAYDTHYNDPSSPMGFSRSSGPVYEGAVPSQYATRDYGHDHQLI